MCAGAINGASTGLSLASSGLGPLLYSMAFEATGRYDIPVTIGSALHLLLSVGFVGFTLVLFHRLESRDSAPARGVYFLPSHLPTFLSSYFPTLEGLVAPAHRGCTAVQPVPREPEPEAALSTDGSSPLMPSSEHAATCNCKRPAAAQ